MGRENGCPVRKLFAGSMKNIKAGDLIRPRIDLVGPEDGTTKFLVLNIDFFGPRPGTIEFARGWLILRPDGTTDIIAKQHQYWLEKV